MINRNTVRNIARRRNICQTNNFVSFGYPSSDGSITRRRGYVFNVETNQAGIPYVRMVIPHKGFRSFNFDKMTQIRRLG